jgi:hypothetical protein
MPACIHFLKPRSGTYIFLDSLGFDVFTSQIFR